MTFSRILLGLSLAGIAFAQTDYDLLIKGGHVIDGKSNLSAVRDVAIKDGKIANVAANIEAMPGDAAGVEGGSANGVAGGQVGIVELPEGASAPVPLASNARPGYPRQARRGAQYSMGGQFAGQKDRRSLTAPQTFSEVGDMDERRSEVRRQEGDRRHVERRTRTLQHQLQRPLERRSTLRRCQYRRWVVNRRG